MSYSNNIASAFWFHHNDVRFIKCV